jgi:ubiquinone/menaquinone biosynthesis C-methylase UbiE
MIPIKLIDQIIFHWQRFLYARSNKNFKKLYPEIALPDPYTLYESYKLDYKKYWEDGQQTAVEIIESVHPYLTNISTILDWGCGPARITRHLPLLLPNGQIIACDSNNNTIEWNEKHISKVQFTVQHNQPPLPFPDNQFDLIIGFSVLTHIPSVLQRDWIQELYRVAKHGGIVWITTHGYRFIRHLSGREKEITTANGFYNSNYHQPGHRMMSTYHFPEKWSVMLEEYFEILEYYDGEKHPNKAGKQDLWILRKKKV